VRETPIQPSLEKRELAGLATILLPSLIIRILLFPLPGYKVDLQDFGSWINTAATYGPKLFYQNASFCDYPPLARADILLEG
jgi:hypothetical protein